MDALPIEDVRAMVRLLGEVAVVPGDIPARRHFLLEGLARIVQADVWLWVLSRLVPDADMRAASFWFIDGGWASDEQRMSVVRGDLSPEMRPIHEYLFHNVKPHVTRTRNQLMPDAEWYNSGLYRKHRTGTGLDDFMMSIYHVSPQIISGLGFHRRSGREPFGPRECCIVHVVTSEIEWLHRAGTDVPAVEYLPSLSPRLRDVLLLILHGDSRKQIGRKLELSEYTVAEYIDTLYKRFNVCTRGELLSLFMSGGGTPADSGKQQREA